MINWLKTARCIGIVCVFGMAGIVAAQEDHLIENQRYVVGIDDFSWGDTFVGKYTSGNGLILEAYIPNNTNLTLNVHSLQIGSMSNYANYVDIYKGGTLEIEGDFLINAPANGNGLTIHDDGIMYIKSDFDAQLDGFSYESGAHLKVGGEISNLDSVEGGLNFTLTGENATWTFGTNILSIGSASSSNSVSIASRASLEIDNISIGSAGTTSNGFIVSDNGRVFVHDSISVLGNDNYLYVTNSGILAVDFDFDASVGIVDVQKGGILEAHQNLIFHGITNGGGVVMSGTNANWSNLSGSILSVGGNTDDNFLWITNGATVRAGNIQVGGPTNINNEILIADGGNLILESMGSTVAATNTIEITGGGKLTLESNYDYGLSAAHFLWHDGGIIEAQREAPVFTGFIIDDKYIEDGALFLNNGKILVLNGANARWSAAPYNLHIGDLSAKNTLIITNGGQAYVNSVSIGDFKDNTDDGVGGNNNTLFITGTDSFLESTTYLALGGTMDGENWYEGGVSNTITVNNAGLLSVGTTLHNRNTTGTCGLIIGPGGRVEAQNYYQANGAYLIIYTDATGSNTGLLRVSDTAEFEEGARVGFDAVAALEIGNQYTNQIVESDILIVGGVTNAGTAELELLGNAGESLVYYDLWETNQDINVTFSRRSIGDGSSLDPDSMLDLISKEIDQLASDGSVAASNQVQILSNMNSDSERKLQLEQMYAYQIPTYIHNQGVFDGINQVLARGSALHGNASANSRPGGPEGPHAEDQGLQGWANVYGSYGSRDMDGESGYMDGYKVQTYGTVLGMDRSFGEWLFGVAGGYAGSTLDGDNDDESKATTGYGVLYANYGTETWFGDLALGYGLSDIENTSGTDFDVTAEAEASHTTVYLGGGTDVEFKDRGATALFRPEFGIQASYFDQDAYSEESTLSLAKDVDAYDRWSARSSLGTSMILPVETEKLDMEFLFRTFWLHEFNNDEETLGYTLQESGFRGESTMRSPDMDAGQIGVSYITKGRNGWQLRADIDLLLSRTYTSTSFGGALLYEF